MNKSIIVMGEYPQNCGLEKEPIEWIVLKEEEHRCLCISKYLLDCKQYHNLLENVIWQDCTLRNWLNSDFLMTAYARKQGAWFLKDDCDDKNNGGWVLRYYGVEDDEGKEEGKNDFITVVNFDGYIEYGADDVITENVCIRPAFWLKKI